jgi:radical SAM protein (TIGR04043 family)
VTHEIALLKFRLLAHGLCVAPGAQALLAGAKPQLRMRSGVSGGLDLVLPGGIHVNAATTESFAQSSPFLLDGADDRFVIRDGGACETPVVVYPRPAYYDRRGSDGVPHVSIGQMCSGDRICIGMTRHCAFWKREDRCTFCSIGLNAPREAAVKTPARIAETVEVAAYDPVLPARHVLIGGGTPNQEDRGAIFAAAVSRAIKRRVDLGIYVMIAPPQDLDEIDRLRDAGADELGMNLEFFTLQAMQRHAPGKLRHIGFEHHDRALRRAVAVFGCGNARSIVIVGLEPAEATVAGAERLAAMGVMPILSPFRPLDGTDLAHERGFTPKLLFEIQAEVAARCARYGLGPGPSCIPCQNNTLALPNDRFDRYYGEPWPGIPADWLPNARAAAPSLARV